jgi:hypothetical protein
MIARITAFFAAWMYYHIAFNSDMMHTSISLEAKIRIWKKIRMGPVSFFAAILLGMIHVAIPICIYILMPFFYMFMLGIDLVEDPKEVT